MRTTIEKRKPKMPCDVVNEDNMVWCPRMPECPKTELNKKKYYASIPDVRLNHMDFSGFGYHLAWADTLDELIDDIKSFGVPYYSEEQFLNNLRNRDANDNRHDRQVALYDDSRRTRVLRGEYNLNNMTAYTSF